MSTERPKKRHDRSEDMAQISVSLPKDLLARIRATAEQQDRSISSVIRVGSERYVKETGPTWGSVPKPAAPLPSTADAAAPAVGPGGKTCEGAADAATRKRKRN